MGALFSWRDDPGTPAFPDEGLVVVYDGDCVMCSAWAAFILRRDRAERFRFVAADSSLGRALYRHLGLDPVNWSTHILLEDGRAWLRSDASLRVLARLGAPWSWLAVLRVVPKRWRDAAYALVARNRYRLFGRRSVCWRPQAGAEHRFLA